MKTVNFELLRNQMLTSQLLARGIRDGGVLEAMRQVPRHEFVPHDIRGDAYRDGALPIGEGQTISQPYIVALMAEAARIEPADHVLDVGTGCGYGAAVLSLLAGEVFSIERHASLANKAATRLRRLGYSSVHVQTGDGTRGWAEVAPFDAIIVAAGGRDIPPALLDQLTLGGRLVIPIGITPHGQQLLRITRTGPAGFDREYLGEVAFVPLVTTGV